MGDPSEAPAEPLRKILVDVTQNAYRILGTTAGASQADLHNAASAIRRAIRLGAARKTDWDLPSLGPVARSEADINDALGRLRDPARRLRERLFWFARLPETASAAGARSSDERAVPPPSAAGNATDHDAALLGLVAAASADPGIVDRDRWAQVFGDWQCLVTSEDYWEVLLEIESSGGFEPAATEDEIEAVRDGTVGMIAGVVATAAAVALEHGNPAACQRAFGLLSDMLDDDELVADLEQQALEPLVSRLQSAADEVAAECSARINREVEKVSADPLNHISEIVHTPGEDAKAASHRESREDANRQVCDAALGRFETEVYPALQDLLSAARPGSDICRVAGEATALCLYRIAVDITWANEFVRSEELRRRASELAPLDSATRIRIEEGLRTVAESARRERVWKDLKPIGSAPTLSTTNGFGFRIYGGTDYDPETDSYLTTYYLTALFIPVIPICRYRVSHRGGNTFAFLGKAPLRRCDKWHLGIVLSAFAALLIAVFSAGGQSGSSTTSYQSQPTYQYQQPSATPDQPATPVDSSSDVTTDAADTRASVKAQIESGKTRLQRLKFRIDGLDTEAGQISAELDTLKPELDRYEAWIRAGLPVDTRSYRAALNHYNSRVQRHNALVQEGKRLVKEHNDLLQHVNDLIDQYNSMP